MKLRKIVSVIISVCLLLSCVLTSGIPASALTAYTVYSDSSIQTTAGQTVTVPVYISNNSGLMGYDMNFTYDDKVLTPVSVTRGAIMTDGFFEDDIEGTTSTDTSFRVFWSHAYPSTENGIMFYLNFNVDSKATGSTVIQVGYDKSATFDGDYDDAALNCSNISIAITNSEYDSNPVLSLSGNDISAGQQFNLDASVQNIGAMKSVKLTVTYDSSNFKYLGMTVNGVTATAIDNSSSVDVTISGFTNKSDGKKFTLKFQSEVFATSGNYAFYATYTNLSGVDRILVKGNEITVNATSSSDSIVIYSDDEIKTEYGEQQLIVPLYIKHNMGLLGYTLTFEYDATVLEPVSAKAGSAFGGSFSDNISKKEVGRFTCLWFNNEDITANGDFITLTFNVLATKETNGVINISYKEKDIISELTDGVRISLPTVNYKVNEVLLSTISVRQMPIRITYFIGQTLDTTGLQINLNYNDGSVEPIENGFSTSGFDSSTPGSKTVTVTYQGKTTTFDVTVKRKEPTKLSVIKAPNKTEYFVDQPLDTSGLELKLDYDDGSSEIITSGYTTSDFSSTTAGSKTVTVSYGGKTTMFKVTVKEKSLTKIYVSKQPTKTTFFIGQALDTAGLELKAEYDDGSSEIITSGYTTNGFSSTTVGSKTVTVFYGGKTTTFMVTVKEKSVTNISIVDQTTKTTYFIGQDLDVSLMKLQVEYDDGSNETITSGFTTSGFDSLTAGTKTVTVTYQGKSTTFDVTVEELPSLLLGDANGDGVVTIIDATWIQKYLAGISTSVFNETAADTDENGSITIIDATFIQKWLASVQSNDNIGQPMV